MGSTVTKGLQTLERLGSEVGNYDYTAIEFGGNDCDFVWSEVANSPDSPHLCKTPLEKFRVVYEEIVRKVRALGSKRFAAADRFVQVLQVDHPRA